MSDEGRSPALTLSLSLVRRVAVLVPATRREEWLREWEGELRWGHRKGIPGSRLVARSLASVRDAYGLRRKEWTMGATWTDLRVAIRSLLRRPGFTGLAVVTLGMGIGASAALFGLLDRVVLGPMPFPESHRLVVLYHRAPGFTDIPRFELSDGYFLHYQEENRTFRAMGLWAPGDLTLTGDHEPMRIPVGQATPGFFRTLDLPPALGRTFTEEEGLPGGPVVVLLSHGFWQERFGADPGVLGRTLTLNGQAREVVGVLPPQMAQAFEEVRLWVPLQRDFATASATSFSYQGVGRLAEGVSLSEADADLTRALYTSPERFPDELGREHLERMRMSVFTVPLKESVVGDVDDTLWLLLGAAGVVLVVALANVANLVLVRTEGRQREVAVRVALGAGRGRLLRHFLLEGGALALLGGLLGVGLAWAGLRSLVAYGPESLPRLSQEGLAFPVLALSAVLALLSAVILGLLPLLRQERTALANGLEQGGRGSTEGPPRRRFRGTLVAGQVGLSLILLVGSGLLLRSFQELRQVDPGFQTQDRLAIRVTIDRSRHPTLEEGQAFWRRLEERTRELPGVRSAGLVGQLPTEQRGGYWALWVADQPLEPGELPEAEMLKTVTGGYVETLGIPLVEGRSFQPSDYDRPLDVTLVSRTLARRYWPEESALGKRVRVTGPEAEPRWRTVVGVVDDVREAGLSQEAPGTLYGLLQPESWSWESWTMNVVVRTSGSPTALVEPLRDAVWSLDPTAPITRVTTLADVVAAGAAGNAFTMLLMGIAAGVSLLLGTVGLYGVVSYLVSQRTREIGVRMALGAGRRQVRAMVLREGMAMAAAGVGLGVVGALAATRVLQSLLFQVSPRDPLVLGAGAVLLLAVTVLACWLPARRASQVDPVGALRSG